MIHSNLEYITMKKIRIGFIIIILIPFLSCNNNLQELNNFTYLNFKDSLTLEISKSDIHNKALVLNDTIVIYKTSTLIYESHNPLWLFEKTKNKKLVDNEYVYTPIISDIDAPYKIIKYEKSNIFKVIKKTDTLYFDFQNFTKTDYQSLTEYLSL